MNLLIYIVGWSLVHFVWQGAAIAAAAAAALRLVPATRPRVRYAVASVALVAMLAWPAITAARLLLFASTISLADASAIGAAMGSITEPEVLGQTATAGEVGFGTAGIIVPNHTLLTIVVAAWLVGVLACATRLGCGWRRVVRLHRAALSMEISHWQQTAVRLAGRIGLQRHVQVVDSARVDTPTVVGWLRPVILLPIAALANLTPAQVEAILAHELTHVRRHDYAVNLLQTLAETLLFYHPGVWWISRQIRAEREHCCDDVAVAVCGSAVHYAAALEELEAWRARQNGFAMAATSGPLLERVRRVLRVPTDHQRQSADVTAFVVLGLLVIVISGAAQQLPASRIGEPPRSADAQRVGPWQLAESTSFEISYPPELEAHVERVGREADAAYAQVGLDLRHELAFKPRLVLFATRSDMERALAASDVPGDVEHILVTLDTPAARLRGELVHEITHVFSSDIIPTDRTDLPRWLHEGLADYERGEWDPGDVALVRELLRSGTVPRVASGADLSGSNPRIAQVLGHAVFDFIEARAGKDGMRQFLLAVRQAPVGGVASTYAITFGLTAADFERSFEEYLRARF